MNTVRLWVLGLPLGVAMQAQAGNTGYTPDPADGMDTRFGSVANTTGGLIAAYPKNGNVTDVYNADRRETPDVNSTTVENRIVLKWPLNASRANIGLLCKASRSVLCFSFLW
jgi:hypothetical protein